MLAAKEACMEKTYAAIGLMSGTSMDGVDAALLKTDGRDFTQNEGQNHFRPYDEVERELLKRAMDEISGAFERFLVEGGDIRQNIRSEFSARLLSKTRHALSRAGEMILSAHEEAVRELLAKTGLPPEKIDIVGFHGQTILHRPEHGLSLQLGDGERLADNLGVEVVDEFRRADVEAGGQGAPLAPVYHRALARQAGLDLPVVMLNVGGVANVTYIGEDDELIAFDAGPGNALIDDWVRSHGAGEMDEGGRLAAAGRLHEKTLAKLLADPFFSQDVPKSLDRNHFSLKPVEELSLEWGARTLTAFTALAVARADFFFPAPARTWIVSGGGAHNPVLMEELAKRLDGEVVKADEMGWSSDFMEAEAFAYLAVRSLEGLPLSFPATTGVPEPLTGGVRRYPHDGG
jgi:anhydro-N-acetylmuramic acid kinase